MNRNFTVKKYGLALIAMCLILSPIASWAGNQVPFKATLSLVAQPAATNPCPTGTFLLQISGGGHATQMGAITDSQSHCQNPVTGAFTDGQYVLTTVGGDTIFGSYSGQLIPAAGNTFAIQGQFTITGGTGRFSGATGGGAASGTQFPNGEATLVLSGTISSVGSN
jgi:hypothetical protein